MSMSIWYSRPALGGALAAVLIVGTGLAVYGQQPIDPAPSPPLAPIMPPGLVHPAVPYSPASPNVPVQHTAPGAGLLPALPLGAPSALPGLITPSDPPPGSIPLQPG